MKLTTNQAAAMTALIKTCLGNMGGSSIACLKYDPCVWVNAYDLVDSGWSQKQAEGTFGSLVAEGLVYLDDGARHSSEPQLFALTENWDELRKFHA